MTSLFTTQDHLMHDLKAPIEIISRLRQDKTLGEDLKKQLESCASYLSELVGDYFKTGSSKTTRERSISDCINKKIELFHDIQFKKDYLAKLDEFVFLKMDSLKFSRVLFNLLTNAEHALRSSNIRRPEITIQTYNNHQYFYLSLSDNGCGFPPEFLNGFVGPSSEPGRGIGLSSVKKLISESGGSVRFENHLNGARIFLQIPIIFKDITNVVLYEDQPLFTHYWQKEYESSQLKFNFHPNPQKISSIKDKEALIFVDVKLGNQCGLELARDLYRKGFSNIYLTTNYDAKKFQDLFYIKGALGKGPPFKVLTQNSEKGSTYQKKPRISAGLSLIKNFTN